MSSDSESCNVVQQKPALHIWKSDSGLQTIDPVSLIVWTYLKINKIEHDVELHTFLYLKRTSSLTVGSEIFNDINAIWNLQKMKFSNTDKNGCVLEQSQIMAYTNYVFESLNTACDINLWVNERNYEHFTRAWYGTALFFPFNRFYLKINKFMIKRQVKLLAKYVSIDEFSKREYQKAHQCMSDLSLLLGTKTYFMGTYPTSLDAYVYGYLCLLLNAPLPDAILQNILKSFPNLVKYVHNITKTYFPDVKEGKQYIKKNATYENEEEAPTKMVIAAGIFAFGAMFFFAVKIGQFKIQK